MAVLRAIASGPDTGMRAIDISSKTGIHQATLHRLLSALVQEGMVRKLDGKRFSLGAEALSLGHAATRMFDIKTMARPSLERLANAPGDVAFLQVRSGPHAICIDRADGTYPLRPMTLQPGERRPLGVGAGSLVLLSYLDEAERERIIEEGDEREKLFPAFTASRLREAVAQTRENGFSKVQGDVVAEMCAFGMPILDQQQRPIAALSCAAIRNRLNDERQAQALQNLSDEIQRLAAEYSPAAR